MPPRRRRVRPIGRVGIGGPTGTSGAGAGGGAVRILVDGRNVQHALAPAHSSGSGPPLPTVALIARLRAAFSPPTEVELILDGHPGRTPSGRLAPGLSVTYSRHATADEVIGGRVADALAVLGPAGAWSVIVVTDDREVRDHARRNGARVEDTAWLAEQLAGGRASGRAGSSAGGKAGGVAGSRKPYRPGTSIGRSG